MAARPAITPSFTCHNVDKTYDYFTSVLGFAGTGKWAGPDGNTMYASAILPTKLGQAPIMMGPLSMIDSPMAGDLGEFGDNLRKSPKTLGNGVVVFFNVPDVDKYFAFIKKNGALIDEPPTDQPWGDRTISVRTPDGYYLTFSSPVKGYKAPPGFGENEGSGATQASAPLTQKIPLPGARKKASATKAPAKKRAASKKL